MSLINLYIQEQNQSCLFAAPFLVKLGSVKLAG